MKVKLNMEANNFPADGEGRKMIPKGVDFEAEIEGRQVLTIKTYDKIFQFDVKHFDFGKEDMILEGVIGNENGIMGRCVFKVNPISHTKPNVVT